MRVRFQADADLNHLSVLVCDVAVADPSTGKKYILGVFDRINAGRFPTQRPLLVYVKLADAEGNYNIEMRFVRRDSGEILMIAQGCGQITDRLLASDFHLEFPPLPIPEPGRYEFQVWANDVYLGCTFIDAGFPQRQNAEGAHGRS